jgi:hypothetical protein
MARHDEAVIQAEVRRLALALAPFGVLSREALRRQVGGDQWREGSFEQALNRGVRTGALEQLAGDFYREARPD